MPKSKFQIEVEFRSDQANKNAKTLQKDIKGIGTKSEESTKKVGFLKRGFSQLSDQMKILSTVGLIGIITGLINAGKSLFQFNKELQKTTKLTADLTGKSGEDLRKFTAQVQSTADVFEEEFIEILTSANTVAKEFGISQEEALEKKLTKGS